MGNSDGNCLKSNSADNGFASNIFGAQKKVMISNGKNSDLIELIFHTKQMTLNAQQVKKHFGSNASINMVGPKASVKGSYQKAENYAKQQIQTRISIDPGHSEQISLGHAKYYTVAAIRPNQQIYTIDQNILVGKDSSRVYYKSQNGRITSRRLQEGHKFRYVDASKTNKKGLINYVYPPGHCSVCSKNCKQKFPSVNHTNTLFNLHKQVDYVQVDYVFQTYFTGYIFILNESKEKYLLNHQNKQLLSIQTRDIFCRFYDF